MSLLKNNLSISRNFESFLIGKNLNLTNSSSIVLNLSLLSRELLISNYFLTYPSLFIEFTSLIYFHVENISKDYKSLLSRYKI